MNSEELVVDSNLEAEIHAMEPHGVTFELQMPEGMDTSEVSEVLELLEVLQNDIPEFDEMLIEAVNSINQESECPEVSVEGNQTASQPSELVDTHDQPQSQLQAGAISKSASRFKVLDDQQLLEIEQNQYSASTKKNTKWGFLPTSQYYTKTNHQQCSRKRDYWQEKLTNRSCD